MNYVKESIERVVALESCDGRYQVNLRGCEPGDDLWKQRVKQVEEYEETVCCKAYCRLTKERKVLRELSRHDAGYEGGEPDSPRLAGLLRLMDLADDMLDDSRGDSRFYVFRPETEDDVTDMCYLGDMTEPDYEFSKSGCGDGCYGAGGLNIKVGRVYVLRTRWGELGKGNRNSSDTQLNCYDAKKYLSCAKELMDGMAGYLGGAFDRKEDGDDDKAL